MYWFERGGPDIFNETTIALLINVDGVQIHSKSRKSFWIISAKIYSENDFSKPFLIAIFYGNTKTRSATDLLADFVAEVNDLIIHGANIQGVVYSVKIVGFACDTPAQAFIKST